jgi:endonuclease/exonuclease/phosphatase (EEP) superfamily protein YafD
MPLRRVAGALVAGTLAVAVPPVTAPVQAAATTSTTDGSDLEVIHANILSQLSVERFQADVGDVLSKEPDIVTYNEVPLRADTVIAPEAYDVHRSHRNRYTAATAVAWRNDEFTLVDSGTTRISNYRKVPDGRNIKLGLRFANWVTLRTADGRQLSVIAAHVAPLDDDMPDLLRPSVRRIGELVAKLAPAGPVLVGGDFNVHYTSGRYPQDLLDDARMVPTYDALGSYFPTGDHRGATIDYLFKRNARTLGVDRHSKFELYSDHDAVRAGYSWKVDAPADTEQFVSDPTGSREARRLVIAKIREALRGAAAGSEVELVSSGFGPYRLYRPVRQAISRGVQVRLTTRSETLTDRERNIARLIREAGSGRSAVVRCRDACARAWRDSGMARGFLLLRDDRGRAVERMDVNRYLNTSLLERSARLTVSTGEIGLAQGEKMLASLP